MTDLELDALVAEKVMGFTVRDGWIFEWRPSPCPDKMPGCCVMHSKEYPVLPRPHSTDIAAAWEVVEKLTDYPSYMDLQITYTASNGWFIEFSKGETSFSSCNQDDELTRAVCLAALRVMGVKMEE